MRIIYVHQYFQTPAEGGAVRSYHLAKGMVDAGMEVEMITSGNQKEYDIRWIDGIKVHYLPVSYDQKFGFFKRIKAFFEFSVQAKKLLRKISRPDLLYITSTPLTTGWIGLWAKRKLAIPYIFEVRDLWPQAPIEVGAIKNKFAIQYLKKLEKRIYQNALSLVGLSPGIANHLRQVSPNSEVHLIPNFSDTQVFVPQKKNESLLKKYELESELTIAYTGALGQVNAVAELLGLAHLAQQRGKNWQFLIMGKGKEEENLKRIAKKKCLKNLKFIPFGSKSQVNEILSLADFAWISFAHLPVLKTNSPNKFFDALAAGKAILVNHKGWVYQLTKKNGLGLSFLPGKLEESFSNLENLESDPVRLQQMKQNSRKLAEQFFAKEHAVARLLRVIDPKKFPAITEDEVYILTA
ncbi:glycosyltransferase involved in cell wall biosynthesis [Algoriphagus iocasae]|uniref:Glycosyltransferase involved in cell wall biosynthesis n=1 Tax=Algoriphagus iocasae TaxID=1836499 RepID=A0A841MXG5_9BACT|nr:glycosyltransferase family 4 protein [Algoriphagus iocasae]MBB6326701.1 glycosyltransferase involved in cell wall biosynthesis [Algoriphagus iocasae]